MLSVSHNADFFSFGKTAARKKLFAAKNAKKKNEKNERREKV